MEKKSIAYRVGKVGTILSIVLFIVFAALKLAGIISWSWWLVFAPIWWTLAVVIVIVALGVLFFKYLGV